MNNEWYLHTCCGIQEIKPHHILCSHYSYTHANLISVPFWIVIYGNVNTYMTVIIMSWSRHDCKSFSDTFSVKVVSKTIKFTLHVYITLHDLWWIWIGTDIGIKLLVWVYEYWLQSIFPAFHNMYVCTNHCHEGAHEHKYLPTVSNLVSSHFQESLYLSF